MRATRATKRDSGCAPDRARPAAKAFEFVIVGDGGRLPAAADQSDPPDAPVCESRLLGTHLRDGARRGPAAVRAVAAYAFRETDLIRLEIVVAVGNTRSQRVAERSAAVREGVLRSRVLLPTGPVDAVMYSLVRPARRPRNTHALRRQL